MADDKEPARLLIPYLQRADELQKHDPLVAYYCRLYAMEKGLAIPQNQRTKKTNSLLVSLMNQLEKDKKLLKLGSEDNLYLEGFALSVFEKADKQDRAGRADLNTAKSFYAASIFFEILNQFGSVQPDLEQKLRYAVWKAADIRKALTEGRKPIPGPSIPPGNEDDLQACKTPTGEDGSDHELGVHLRPGNTTDGSHLQPCGQSFVREPYPSDEPSSHSYPNFQSYPSFTDANVNLPPVVSHGPYYQQGLGSLLHTQSLPPFASCPSSVPYCESASIGGLSVTSANGPSAFHPSHYQPLPETVAEAHKAAKLAVGALAFDDVPVAVDYLRKSLELLTNPTSSR